MFFSRAASCRARCLLRFLRSPAFSSAARTLCRLRATMSRIFFFRFQYLSLTIQSTAICLEKAAN